MSRSQDSHLKVWRSLTDTHLKVWRSLTDTSLKMSLGQEQGLVPVLVMRGGLGQEQGHGHVSDTVHQGPGTRPPPPPWVHLPAHMVPVAPAVPAVPWIRMCRGAQ